MKNYKMKTKIIGACSIVGIMIGFVLLNEKEAMLNLILGGILLVGGIIGGALTFIHLKSQK